MLKTRWPWLLLAAVLLVGFCGWAAVRVRSSDWYVAETKYARIKAGMMRVEVRDIMGSPTFVFDNLSTSTYLWWIGDHYVIVDFEHRTKRVVSKFIGLKSLRSPDSPWNRFRAWLAF